MGHRIGLPFFSVARANAVVREEAFLCTAGHDIHREERSLVTGRITTEAGAWVVAEAFIGMDVTIGRGAIVPARGVVVRDVAPLAVVAANPSRVVGTRRYQGL